MLGWGGVAGGILLFALYDQTILAWVALGAAFGPLVFFRLAGQVVASGGALAAVVTGFSLAVIFYLLPDTPGDIAERLLPFMSGVTILLLSRRPESMT